MDRRRFRNRPGRGQERNADGSRTPSYVGTQNLAGVSRLSSVVVSKCTGDPVKQRPGWEGPCQKSFEHIQALIRPEDWG
jgi:hypothetical protein